MEKFTHLSYQERRQIYRGVCDGLSQREIASRLGRHYSTISREIRRNSDHIGYLYADEGQKAAESRKYKQKSKIDKWPKLKEYVIRKLKKCWSPRAIAGRWNQENAEKTISAEAIYQWIYEGGGFEFKKLLVRARKKRGLKRKMKRSKIKERISIHDRPEAINNRVEFGHYEADLIFNRGSQSKNILTLTERVTRHTFLIRNNSKHSEAVINALIRFIEKSEISIKSITFDNGTEFSWHYKLHKFGIKTYFCDPAAPWQKGSCEHLNGMLRRYLPFDMQAQEISAQQVIEINEKINNMPRAILGFKTPIEAFAEMHYV